MHNERRPHNASSGPSVFGLPINGRRVIFLSIALAILFLLVFGTSSVLWSWAKQGRNGAGVPLSQIAVTSSPCGEWQIAPNVGLNQTSSHLTAMGYSSPNDLWALGNYDEGTQQPYAAHWNGTTWTTTALPKMPNHSIYIQDISGLASDNVWAVGTATDKATNKDSTYIVHWDGRQWSVVPSPNPNAQWNRLQGVAAASANDIWAVGSYEQLGRAGLPLVIHWDGNKWSQNEDLNSVSLGKGYYDELLDVVVVSPDDVWAVGKDQVDDIGNTQALIVHWDGGSWKNSPLGAKTTGISSAIALSHDNIWAAGDDGLTIHWNGQDWQVSNNPHTGSWHVQYSGMDARSSSDVWAVGTESVGWPIVIHWDGTAWADVLTPWDVSMPHVDPYISLDGIAVAPDGHIWIAGGGVFAEGNVNTPPQAVAAQFESGSCSK